MLRFYTHIFYILISSRTFSCSDTFKLTFFEIFNFLQVIVPKKLPNIGL